MLRIASPLSGHPPATRDMTLSMLHTWVLPGFLPARISATRFVTGGRPASSCFTSGVVFSCAVCRAVNRGNLAPRDRSQKVCHMRDTLPGAATHCASCPAALPHDQ